MSGIPAASAAGDRRVNRRGLVFWLPLVGYWLLAILLVCYPQPPWVVAILGSPLVLAAFVISWRHFNGQPRRVMYGDCSGCALNAAANSLQHAKTEPEGARCSEAAPYGSRS
jgi:hypothetical protein